MRFDISEKLSIVMLGWVIAFLLPWQFGIVGIAMNILLATLIPSYRPVSPQSRRYVNRFLVYSLIFTAVLVTVNGLLIRTGAIRLAVFFLTFYDDGIIYGLAVSIRILLLSFSILVFFASTHLKDFTSYLHSAGLSNSFVSIILLAIFFLEQVPKRITQIFTAQEARGAPVRGGILQRGKALSVVLSPLILSSIVESVERGTALELRGFHSYKAAPSHAQTQGTPWARNCLLFISFIIFVRSVYLWLTR